jgi:Fe-S-cluster containining protein
MRTIRPLRAELVIEQDTSKPEVPFVLTDRGLGRRIRLDEIGALVAEHLDRPQTLDELAERLKTKPSNLERAVAFFEGYHLLDTEQTRTMVSEASAATKMQAMDAQTVPLIIRDDARFSCTMCGSCCGGTNIGPVSDSVMEGLKPHLGTLEKKMKATSGLFFTVPGGSGDKSYTLCRQKGGSCVFLEANNRCAIHADYGAEAKPDDCRLFPWMFTATPKGVAVSIQMECRGFTEARSGKLLSEQEDEIRKMLALAQDRSQLPPILTVTGHLSMTYDAYDSMETLLHETVDRLATDPLAALIAMRDIIFKATDLESDTSVSRKESLKTLLHRVMGKLCGKVQDIRDNLVSSDPNLELHTETLDLVAQALQAVLSDLERVFAPPDRRAKRELFAEKVHHYLMQKELITFGSVINGYVYLVFQWVLSQALSIHRAREVKRRHVTEQDLMDAMSVMSLVWRTPEWQALLEEMEDELTMIFMDQLHQFSEDLPFFVEEDLKGHIYKF